MSIEKLSVTCPNEDCEHIFEFEAEFDPGDPGGWSEWDGGWPPIPASFYPVEDPLPCPKCGTNCFDDAQAACDEHTIAEPDYNDKGEDE